MNKWKHKEALALAGCAVLCVVATHVYVLFGHGVRSAWMDWMCLYPLGGAALSLLLARAGGAARPGRLMLNAGIATCTAASFLKGVMEIAGATSPYALPMMMAGWGLVAVGLALIALLWRRGRGQAD